jgi:hypothetical protein
MRVRVCYLDCHEGGLCCYLVIHIGNLLHPLQLFYFYLCPIYWLSLVVRSCVYKYAINPITNPNPIYTHSVKLWQYDCIKLSQWHQQPYQLLGANMWWMVCLYFKKDCVLLHLVLFYKEISSVLQVLFVFHLVSDASMFLHCSGFIFYDYLHNFWLQVARIS